MSELSVTSRDQRGLDAHVKPVDPIDRLVNAIASNELTAQNATAAYELYKTIMQDRAKQTYAEAFAKLKKEIPQIIAKRIIPNKDQTVRSTFAAFEDLIADITPHLEANGFTLRFESEALPLDNPKQIVATCILTHTSGHENTAKFGALISAPPSSSGAQACTATNTTAKRGALCNMFGIAVNHEDDARLLGDYIKPHQAESLRQRLEAVGGNMEAFFKMARAPVGAFDQIRAGVYATLDSALLMKEKSKK